MEQALIICDAPKGREFYEDILTKNGYEHLVTVTNGEEGKRALADGEFDICVINTPMRCCNAIGLAKEIAMHHTCQVLLFVREESFEATAEAVEDYGVLTISKPVNRQAFWSTLKLVRATAARIANANSEIKRLQKKLDEQKVIGRAKCFLIEKQQMTETDAHHYMEKQAMDRRVSLRLVAEDIVDFYSED